MQISFGWFLVGLLVLLMAVRTFTKPPPCRHGESCWRPMVHAFWRHFSRCRWRVVGFVVILIVIGFANGALVTYLFGIGFDFRPYLPEVLRSPDRPMNEALPPPPPTQG